MDTAAKAARSRAGESGWPRAGPVRASAPPSFAQSLRGAGANLLVACVLASLDSSFGSVHDCDSDSITLSLDGLDHSPPGPQQPKGKRTATTEPFLFAKRIRGHFLGTIVLA